MKNNETMYSKPMIDYTKSPLNNIEEGYHRELGMSARTRAYQLFQLHSSKSIHVHGNLLSYYCSKVIFIRIVRLE